MENDFTLKQRAKNQDFDAINNALNEVKDRTILLMMAKEYLCEDKTLNKMGVAIQKNLDDLTKGVNELRRNSVGVRLDEIDLRPHIFPMKEIARRMRSSDGRSKDHCTEGRLGKELYENLTALLGGVRDIRRVLQGEDIDYTAAEKAVGLLGRLKFIFIGLMTTSKLALKLAGVAVIAGIMAFGYLYFTMVEAEKELVGVIQNKEAQVLISEKDISGFDAKLKLIREDIARLKQIKSTREDEIKLIDLNVKEHELADERRKAIVEKDMLESELKASEDKLKEMNEKPYLMKLLRF
ncbi:hypothetical protein ACFL2O_03860 [Thermodesulfobacteriota bacterium]